MVKICKLISCILISTLVISCSNIEDDINKDGNGENKSVKVKNISLQFKDTSFSRSDNGKKVAGIATSDIDGDYMFVAELINLGKIDTPQTRADYTESVTGFDVFTFYDQEEKDEPRYQNLNGSFSFELPSEGNCSAVFLGYVDKPYEQESVQYNPSDKNFNISSVSSELNLCYCVKDFGDEVPDVIENLEMTPLFSKISSIAVAENTDGSVDGVNNIIDAAWPITQAENLKLAGGVQNESGEIIVSKYEVSYTKTQADSEIELNSVINKGSNEIDENVIPNGNNLKIKMDITLEGLGTKTAGFNFGEPLESGYRYQIKLSVRKKGIIVRFQVNTQQKGEETYNATFDKLQNDDVNIGMYSTVDNVYYYKYGETLTLPVNPQRTGTDYFNPADVMTFKGWYTSKECYVADKLGSTCTLTTDNFESLKTSSVINIYAYFEPHFYYWNSSSTIADGGIPVRGNSSFPNYKATDSEFLKLPTGDQFKQYAAAPKYYDDGYTDDKQQGVWFLKWNPSSGNKGTKDYAAISNAYCNDLYNTNFFTIHNGVFPSGVNKDDYFFVPVLGEWNDENDGTQCTTKNSVDTTSEDCYCWSSNIYDALIYNDTLAPVLYYSKLGVQAHAKKGSIYYGKQIMSEGLLRYWPDQTFISATMTLDPDVSINDQVFGGTKEY